MKNKGGKNIETKEAREKREEESKKESSDIDEIEDVIERKNIDFKSISEVTGLSEKQIEEI